MQLKIATHIILVTCLVYPLSGKTLSPKECQECQEEVWEEVACGSIPRNASTVPSELPSTKSTTTSTAKPTVSTTKEPSPVTTASPVTRPSTTTSPESTTATDPYKKCYCECKLGCKEFCRKVAVNPSEKQITQVSKITEKVENGRIKTTHILQRELVPKSVESHKSSHDNYAPSDNDESEVEDYTMPQAPYPLPDEDSCEEESEVESEPFYVPYHQNTKIPYFAKPIVPLIKPVYGPYAITEATVNKNMHQFNPHSAKPQQPAFFSAPHLNAHDDFPIPFQNVYSKITKSLHDSTHSAHIAVDDSTIGKVSKPQVISYASSAPVIDSPLEQHSSFDQYDDSYDSILRNAIRSDPSNETPYYSLPHNSL